MGVLQDVRSLLYGARLFGCTPHRIVDDCELIITKVGSIYSIFVALLMSYACIAGLYFITHDNEIEFKMQLLTAIRTFCTYICVFTDGIITIMLNNKLRRALRLLHNFDRITKFGVKMNGKLSISCRLLLITVLVYWCSIGYLTYLCETNATIFHGITYGFVNAAMSMQVLKFVGMLILLYQRLRHLDELIKQRVPSISILFNDRRILSIQDIWTLHHSLTTAAKDINVVYSIQLLFWITLMFLNGLSRLYTLATVGNERGYLKIRDIFSVIACIVNLFIIAATCHFTAAKANSIGTTLFTPHQSLIQRRKNIIEDNVEVAMYFYLRKLHFTAAAGFIRVNLPLLLSIAGAMTTYLVILDAMNGS